ncbi:MAG TPA: accessory Sec system translocase SecA2 [Candidatus Angelobacter sp.]|nr:accessory Sec system translocase SecA2 [Candidatus Angelobacter sp.]
MTGLLRSLFGSRDPVRQQIEEINALRVQLKQRSDADLRSFARSANRRVELIASAAAVAARVLGQEMFDVQLRGALALTEGRIVEMQTGEGKTLAAVPAVICYAQGRQGVHVMTVNDYLARRDAQWMRGIYEYFGLSVGYIQREMTTAERKQAYACDITYATANEIGFDFLRDQLALYADEQVHRPFAAAVIDEADSILIDEARIPLVIAGGDSTVQSLPYRVDAITRRFRCGVHFTVDEHRRNVALTDYGAQEAERAFRCGNLYEEQNLNLLCAIQDSLHAHAFLQRDVDYLVKDGAIQSVDEFKGRVIQDRRWPAGLHSAIEAKEGVALKKQGQVLGSITLQNLVALYPQICGMTGTAATQKRELKELYGLEVEIIPTNRPVIRVDHPDVLLPGKREKEEIVVDEIFAAHAIGRPVLVGTTSVEESERLSRRLRQAGIPHHVLNARNEEEEAGIIALAGQRGSVTISTNMAGRGTDIQLGPGVAELGGLYVIGTNKHESRRIDNQLRGRAGRQGDPGSSRFFISLEDDLMQRFAGEGALQVKDPDAIQRVAEGQNLTIRQFLNKYESVIEGQRQLIQRYRQQILVGTRRDSAGKDNFDQNADFGYGDDLDRGGETESDVETEVTDVSGDPMPETERLIRLATIDELWSDYLAEIADYRAGIDLVSWSRDPLHEYLITVHQTFTKLRRKIEKESERRVSEAASSGTLPRQRGATWTYLTSDEPFGPATERIMRGLARKAGFKTL